jgi:ABC-type polysaccharide/polyol phosphate transport system ATPase subunit
LEDSWLKGRTVIIVSHSSELIEKYCSRTILMNKGEMVFLGDSKEAIEIYNQIS